MKLICITGIDGAGKTTLVRGLVGSLNDQHAAIYLYGRISPFISRLLMVLGRATLLRKHNIWSDYTAYSASKRQYMRNPLLSWSYKLSVLLDFYIQIYLKLGPRISCQKYVVLDRYLYDTVINDLAAQLDYSDTETLRAIESGFRFLPVPLLTILIDLPEEIAYSRKSDVPHVEFLRERRCFYLSIAQRPEVKQLSGLLNQDELLQAALHLIRSAETSKSIEVLA